MPSKKAEEGRAAVKKPAAAAATPTKREAGQLLEGNDANGGAAVKRRKGLGVRVIGGRIYDSENGKTCHQCRQKTIDFMAPCKAIVGKKACTQNFCAKCLLNRYGEKVAEVAQLQNWSCPRCRGDCNCSICLKKQGCVPTGILTPTAKATGFTSVADLLKKRPAIKAESVTLSASPTKQAAQKGSKKGCPKDDPSEKGDGCLVEEAVLGESAGTPTRSSAKRGDSASKKRKLIVTAEGEVEGPVANALLSTSPSRQKTAVAKVLLTTSTSNQKKAKKTPVAKQTLLDEVLRIKPKKKVTFSANPIVELGVVPLNGIPENSEKVQVLPVKAKKKKKSEKECNAGVPPPAEVTDNKQLVSNSNVKATKKDSKDIRNVGTDVINVKAETGSETCTDAGGKALPKKATKRKEKPIEDDGQKQQGASKYPNSEAKEPKKRSQARGSQFAAVEEEIVLPQGKSLVMVAGMDFPTEAVGPALQLVEFCSVFNTVLGLKRGDAEAMLRELTKGRLVRKGPNSLLVQLHAKLLNLIEQGSSQLCGKVSQFSSGKNSWLHILKKHVTERSCVFSGLTTNKGDIANDKTASSKASSSFSLEKDLRAIMDAIEGGAEGYENLGMYHKLQLLIILCDDSLETECMRSFIDSVNREFCDAQKENREEVLAARKDARDARQKIKDAEVAKLLATVNIVGPLAPEEKEALLSRVQAETERAVAAAAVVKEAVSRLNKGRSDAVRTNAIAWTPDGRAFYRLKGVHDMNSVVLQAAANVDSSELSARDCWSIYPKEEEEVVFKYLSYRARASRKRSVAEGELEEEEAKAKEEAEEEKENRMPNSDFAKLEPLS